MDLQSFIQSGLLEAYVLGQCSAEERAQVERMAAEYAEVRAELSSIEASLESYAAAHAVSPPDWMKARIMDRLEQETEDKVPPNPSKPRSGKGALGIFQILTFLLAALSAFLFLRQKDAGRENDQLKSANTALSQELATCKEEVLKPDPIAELLCDPTTQRILVSNGSDINTVFYYNARLKKMAYDPTGLPNNSGKNYQFWAIVGGKPISLGMKADNMCSSLQTVENAVAFAISEEPNPEGNPLPSKVAAIANI